MTTPRTLADMLFAHGVIGYDDFEQCECGVVTTTRAGHALHLADVIHAWLREQANDPEVVEAVARAGLSEEAWRVWGESMRDDSREDARNALAAFLGALGGGA